MREREKVHAALKLIERRLTGAVTQHEFLEVQAELRKEGIWETNLSELATAIRVIFEQARITMCSGNLVVVVKG